MNKTKLRKYASLIVRTGVNVQKGQEVFISADLDQPEFVAMVVEEAYRAEEIFGKFQTASEFFFELVGTENIMSL